MDSSKEININWWSPLVSTTTSKNPRSPFPSLRKRQMTLNSCETLVEIQSRIEQQWKIPVDDQQLTYEGDPCSATVIHVYRKSEFPDELTNWRWREFVLGNCERIYMWKFCVIKCVWKWDFLGNHARVESNLRGSNAQANLHQRVGNSVFGSDSGDEENGSERVTPGTFWPLSGSTVPVFVSPLTRGTEGYFVTWGRRYITARLDFI